MTTLDAAPARTGTFNARALALAWRSVAQAYSTNSDRPMLDRTIAIEWHDDGIRLVATDGILLLHSWVPDLDGPPEPPDLDIAPEGITAARDPHGRAVGLMAHLAALTADDDAPMIDVRIAAGIDLDDEPGSLGGMHRMCVAIEVPDQERLKLWTYEGEWVPWRSLLTKFERKTTDRIALNPELVARLAKVGKLHGGLPIVWRFGGADAMARVELLNSNPALEGVAMPIRFDEPAPT